MRTNWRELTVQICFWKKQYHDPEKGLSVALTTEAETNMEIISTVLIY
jgi:hypothetical protein